MFIKYFYFADVTMVYRNVASAIVVRIRPVSVKLLDNDKIICRQGFYKVLKAI